MLNNPIVTKRMLRDYIIFSNGLSLRDMCELMSLDFKLYSGTLLEMITELEDAGQVEFDDKQGIYKSNITLS